MRAIELRKAGATYPAIGEQLGMSTVGAWKAVQKALKDYEDKTAEDVAILRYMHRTRLESLLMAVWNRALTGDTKAWDQALKLLDSEARFDGLNLPDKYAPTDPAGEKPYDPITDTERAARLEKILHDARARRDREARISAEEGGADPG